MQKVLAIVGPTAVGKTAASIKVAHQFNGEVISGDSMQVYRHLDIGTAKITPAEMAGVPHHLIDILDANERYSASQFQADAHQLIEQIGAQKKLPIIVGGTGFYLQALQEGLSLGGDEYTDSAIRDELRAWANEAGVEKLHHRLQEVDPVSAAQIPVNNTRRVIRALEVYQKTGQPFSQQENQASEYDFMVIGLNTDRQLLYDRINLRVDEMLTSGLEKEARWLFEHGGESLPAGKAIGYRELYPYFSGEIDLPTAVAKIKQDSRHYAKRQLTWFKNKTQPLWYDLVTDNNGTEMQRMVNDIGKWLEK